MFRYLPRLTMRHSRALLRRTAATAESVSMPDEIGEPATKQERETPFEELSSSTQRALQRHNVNKLFPIQSSTLPWSAEGRDVIGRAFTGTGKTLAYLLPIVEGNLLAGRKSHGRAPSVLIMTPTRELAVQVIQECSKFLPDLKSVAIYGGTPYERQIASIERGVDVVVGTPGRLQDLVNRQALSFEDLEMVILDEADTMLNMGFKRDVEELLISCPKERQTLLFSATYPPWVLNVAKEMMKDPVTIDLIGEKQNTAETLAHFGVELPAITAKAAERALSDLIHVHGVGGRVIIFVRKKTDAARLAESPLLEKFGARALHGDMSQAMREVTMTSFRKNKFRVLIATDVAARGLDVPEVDVTIQLEVPEDDMEMYVHRSGRAGRAGRLGKSFVLYTTRDAGALRRLEKFTGVTFERISLPPAEDIMLGAANSELEVLNTVPKQSIEFFTPLAQTALEENSAEKLIAAALATLSGFRELAKPVSLLSGSQQHTSVMLQSDLLRGSYSYAEMLKRMAPEVAFGRLASVSEPVGAVVVDVPNQHVEGVIEMVERDDRQISVSTPKQLPSLHTRHAIENVSRFRSEGRGGFDGGRGGRGGRGGGGGGFGGGRGGRGGRGGGGGNFGGQRGSFGGDRGGRGRQGGGRRYDDDRSFGGRGGGGRGGGGRGGGGRGGGGRGGGGRGRGGGRRDARPSFADDYFG